MKYRSDIDGLRTIAVFLVILNHAGFAVFSGGFVGVDVFFVISGFLITSIIYPLLLNRNFSIAWFLGRRIKRLMPVLLFVIFITTIVFSWVLLPQDLIKYYRSVIYVILYAANFFFWREHGGYFDGGSEEVPLLHTWSLAVEEQYYLVWPLILAFSVKFLGAKKTIFLSIALCIVATLFSQWGTEVTIGAAYYLLPTRFFELLVGSCLAITWNYLPVANKNISHILSGFGLFLIIISAIMLNEHSSFPGYNALYPVIGTALIIYASSGFVNRFLALKPIVFTGNISYSLYLWHWPILVFFRYTSIELTLTNQIFAISLTYVLSVLSWKYIENPTRHMKLNSFKKIATAFYLIPSLIIISISAIGIYFNGYTERFSNDIIVMERAVNTFSSQSRKLCHSSFRDSEKPPNKQCVFGDKSDDKHLKVDVFVFGDSHANHLVPFIKTLTTDAGLSGQDYTLDRCVPIFDLNWGSNLFLSKICKERNKLAFKYIQQNNFNYVVLAASWPDISTKRIFKEQRVENKTEKLELFQQQLDYTLTKISETGAVPIIINDTPTLRGKSPKCPIKKEVFDNQLDCSITSTPNYLMSKMASLMKDKYPKLVIISPEHIFCKENNCSMSLNGIPLYRDEDHLNEVGSSLLGVEYLRTFPNPFVAKKEIQ